MQVIRKVGLSLFSAGLSVFLVACEKSTIPDQQLELEASQIEMLKAAEPISVTKANFFDVTCGIHDPDSRPGALGYYLTSSGTKMTDDYAKWACGGDTFAYLKCPYITVTEEQGTALVDVHRGSVEDYSHADIVRCVTALINNAPEELLPTSEEIRNRDSYKNENAQINE